MQVGQEREETVREGGGGGGGGVESAADDSVDSTSGGGRVGAGQVATAAEAAHATAGLGQLELFVQQDAVVAGRVECVAAVVALARLHTLLAQLVHPCLRFDFMFMFFNQNTQISTFVLRRVWSGIQSSFFGLCVIR